MDFFFDTALIFLALVVVLIITAITGIILVRDVVRFGTRRKREHAAEAAPGRPSSGRPATAAAGSRTEAHGGTPDD